MMDQGDHERALDMLEEVTFTDTRMYRPKPWRRGRDQAWFHMGEADTAAAFAIGEALFLEDSSLNRDFKLFLEFVEVDREYPGHPCEYPVPVTYNWLKTNSNSGSEIGFGAESALAAIDDKVFYPTPLQWPDEEEGKWDKRLPEKSEGKEIWVYPVPATQELWVKAAANGHLALIDINGHVLLTKTIAEGTQTLQVTEIPSGYYIAVFKNNVGDVKRTPIIISR